MFTRFNAINFILAAVIILAGSPKNAIFVGVIIVNTLIGVIQEVKAKYTLEKLSVISAAHAKVLRDGEVQEIPIEEIVLDDVLYLETGLQILADGEVLYSNGLEIDESMLTGEADAIAKRLCEKNYYLEASLWLEMVMHWLLRLEKKLILQLLQKRLGNLR